MKDVHVGNLESSTCESQGLAGGVGGWLFLSADEIRVTSVKPNG